MGNRELVFNGYRVSVEENEKKFWRWMVVKDIQQCECNQCHKTVKMVKMVTIVYVYLTMIKKIL